MYGSRAVLCRNAVVCPWARSSLAPRLFASLPSVVLCGARDGHDVHRQAVVDLRRLSRSLFRGQIPSFYKEYVKEVQSIIDANARLEFDAINREHTRTGTRHTFASTACVWPRWLTCTHLSLFRVVWYQVWLGRSSQTRCPRR